MDIALKTFHLIFSQADPINLHKLYDEYVAIVKDQDNPFFPFGSPVEQSDRIKARASFQQAHELYQQVIKTPTLEPARLYKLNEVSDSMVSIVQRVKTVERTKFTSFGTMSEALTYIAELQSSSNQQDVAIGTTLNRVLERIEKSFKWPAKTSSRTRSIGPVFQDVADSLVENAENPFFKTDSGKKTLQQLGAIYYPNANTKGNIHTWGSNLAWMIAHLRKGNRFIICSDIETNQYRRGLQAERIPSAFAREVCMALKAGYTLCKDATGSTLLPVGLEQHHLRTYDSTGILGNGVNPSFGEMELIYHLLKTSGLKDKSVFQCHFNFTSGEIEFVEGPRLPNMAKQTSKNLTEQVVAMLSPTATSSFSAGNSEKQEESSEELIAEKTVILSKKTAEVEERQRMIEGANGVPDARLRDKLVETAQEAATLEKERDKMLEHLIPRSYITDQFSQQAGKISLLSASFGDSSLRGSELSQIPSTSRTFLPLENSKKERAAIISVALAQQQRASLIACASQNEVTSTSLMDERQAEALKELLLARGIEPRLITTTHTADIANSYAVEVRSYNQRDLETARELMLEYEKEMAKRQGQGSTPQHK